MQRGWFWLVGFIVGAMLSMGVAQAQQITLWEHEKEEDQVVLDELIAKFEKANPGTKIKRAHYKTEDMRAQFQTAAMGGGGGDIVLAPNDFAGPFSLMGIIKPVNTWTKTERFFPAVVQAVSDKKNQVWGLPVTNGNHLMLFVNKKIVPQSPKTLEDLITAAKKTSDPAKNKYGFAYNLNEPFWFATFLGAYGESPLVQQVPRLDSKGMIDALELVHSLKFKEKIVPPDCDYTCADTLFVEGKVGMTINGDWAVQKYAAVLKDDLIIAPLPKLSSTGQYMVPLVSGKYVFYNKNLKGKKLEIAQKFGEFLVSKPIQEFLVTRAQRLPVLKDMAKHDAVVKNQQISAALGAMEHGKPMPMDIEMRVVWDAIRPQLQGVMAGRTQARIAAQTMQKDAENKIRELKE